MLPTPKNTSKIFSTATAGGIFGVWGNYRRIFRWFYWSWTCNIYRNYNCI